ncbi:MAG: hypothetical protein JXA71_11920 [Chitinispirillaceae bacterium]|nr:hypothetical protein [Chitinispirillaceae bacterium]
MKRFVIFALIGCFALPPVVAAQDVSFDPLYIYKDLPSNQLLYSRISFCDTLRRRDTLCFYETDTGSVYDSNAICFNYQLVNGYAGFKTDWDRGVTSFPLGENGQLVYKGMVLAHKGPLPGHKVTVRWGYNTGCGSPTTFQTFGEFSASAEWKVDTILLPPDINPDGGFYEMQLLINDVSGAQTSGPGVLKLDDMAFIKTVAGVKRRPGIRPALMNAHSFTPVSAGTVMLSAYALSGGLLFSMPVAVEAGKTYRIDEFVTRNVCTSVSQIHCVRIKGAGVDLMKKLLP